MDTNFTPGLEPFLYYPRVLSVICDRERGICASPIRKDQMIRHPLLIGSKNGAKHVVTLMISQALES